MLFFWGGSVGRGGLVTRVLSCPRAQRHTAIMKVVCSSPEMLLMALDPILGEGDMVRR